MRAFRLDEDLVEVNKWLIARKKDPLKRTAIPKVGMIIEGVAVGFLATSDTDTCFMEDFVTNPEAKSEVRHKAIARIATWAENLASTWGYEKIIVLSNEECILKRAYDMNFEIITMSIGIKKL